MPPLPVPTDAELEELARTLDTPEIPSKLRCGICDLLAYDTMRLPCCSTNICDKCYQNEVGEECIICCHKPLDKTLCEPNKPMRTTIKVLLKQKFNARAKKQAESAKVEQIEAAKDIQVAADPLEQQQQATSVEDETPAIVTEGSTRPEQTEEQRANESDHLPAQIDVTMKGPLEPLAESEEPTSPHEDDDDDIEIITESVDDIKRQAFSGDDDNDPPVEQNFNQMNTMNPMNGFPMDFNQMMAAAQSMLPMAGMPNMMGMGMMPMMSQMFGGFDNSNMGMNGMNMGMGGFQGNGSWMNNNQGNFNNNSYGNGNFGHGSAGYSMSAGAQNNYNQINESYANNDLQRGYGRQGFQNRRGRRGYYNGGGFGRGGNNYNQGNGHYGYAANQEQLYPQNGEPATGTNGTSTIPANGEHDAALEASFAPGGEHDFDEELGRTPNETEIVQANEDVQMSVVAESKETPSANPVGMSMTEATTSDNINTAEEAEPDHPLPIQSFVPDEPLSQYVSPVAGNIPTGPASRGFNRATFTSNMVHTDVNSIAEPRGSGVVGAPTGPRALREGLPNTGRSGFRYAAANKPTVAIPSGPRQTLIQSPAPKQELNHEASTVRSRSRSPSIIQQETKHSRRQHRSRTQSQDRDVDAEDHKYAYRSHSHRSRDRDSETINGDNYSKSSRKKHDDEEVVKETSRSSKHKSRRHRDEEYEEDYDNHSRRKSRHGDNEEDKHRSSKRSHRHGEEETDSLSRRRHRERTRSPGHRSSKDKSRHHDEYPEEDMTNQDHESRAHHGHHSKHTESRSDRSSRKRRARDNDHDDEDGDSQERKRSRHDQSPQRSFSIRGASSKPNTPLTPSFTPTGPASSRHPANGMNGHPTHNSQATRSVPTGPRGMTDRKPASREVRPAKESEPRTTVEPEKKKPEKDPHTLEREARDRERLQREMQRRAFVDVGGKKKGSSAPNGTGAAAVNGRRVSYKYEDEGSLDARRIEREREAGRWR